MMPPTPDPAARGSSFQLPGSADRQPHTGQLFTLALLKAGRDNCTCESCNILKRIVNAMEAQIEETPTALT